MADANTERRRLLVEAMRRLSSHEEYFGFELTASEDDRISFNPVTQFAGPHPDQKGWELREPRRVAHGLYDLVYGSGNYLAVHDAQQLAIWLHVGGPALVEESVARAHLADLLEPRPAVPLPLVGFTSPELLPAEALRRQTPTKLRMAVLKRDGFRCRICGRNADDSIDIRLHVHHVRPLEWGGLTVMENLITLCHTCHEGLDPHYEFSLIPLVAPFPDLEDAIDEAGTLRYRDLARRTLEVDQINPEE